MANKGTNSRMYGKDTDLDKRFEIIGMNTMRLDHVMSNNWRGEVELRGLTLRGPREEGNEFLVVLKGFDGEGGPVVAFHSALTPSEAIAGAVKRFADGNLKWKPDEYYS